MMIINFLYLTSFYHSILWSFAKVYNSTNISRILTDFIKWFYLQIIISANDTVSFSYLKERPAYLFIKVNVFLYRYSVKVALPHPVTIQVRTSKPDAFIKLQILENAEVIVSSTGKGQVIIPAINLLGNEKALSCQCKCGFWNWLFRFINRYLCLCN